MADSLIFKSCRCFHDSQPRTLRLQSRLYGSLVDASSLITYCSKINEHKIYEMNDQMELVIRKASSISDTTEKCLSIEAMRLLSSNGSPHDISQERVDYPDLIAGRHELFRTYSATHY